MQEALFLNKKISGCRTTNRIIDTFGEYSGKVLEKMHSMIFLRKKV